ncbi:hypothetical protein JD844_013674 [Phrynosoma platyrhinos]|uniref:Uncharacterized protein n=1 Tax=Phrynosoma platyrhinos TaxID=52577 RepID=A0ABQ7TM04_PHRPL|nr:hypothetical protein JD844_013674 [Phrynosoma platyrhinos]
MENWVKEHSPEICAQVVALAEDFLLRQRETKRWEKQVMAENISDTEQPLSDTEQEQRFKQEGEEDTASLGEDLIFPST